MPIRLPCGCGKTLSARDAWVGKKVKCPACGAILIVPAPAAPAPAERTEVKSQPTSPPAEPAPGATPPPRPRPPFGRRTGAPAAAPTPQASEEGAPEIPPPKKRGRLVLLAAAGVLAVALAAGAYLFFARRGGRSPWDYIPRPIAVIGALDVERLMKVESIAGALRDALRGAPRGEAFYAQTGLDPMQIRRVHFGFDPETSSAAGGFQGVVLVETASGLQEAAIAESLRKDAPFDRTMEMGGRTAYVLKARTAAESPTAVLVLDEHRLLVGSLRFVRAAAAMGGASGSVLDNSELMAVCDGARRGDMAWIAGRLTEVQRERLAAAEAKSGGFPGGELISFMAAGNYQTGRGLSVRAALGFASESAAGQAVAALIQLKGLALMMGVPDDGATVGRNGSEVTAALEISDDVLTKARARMRDPVARPPAPPAPSPVERPAPRPVEGLTPPARRPRPR